MGQGFRVLKSDGVTVQIDSDSIGFLFAKETYLSSNGTIAVPNAAGRNVRLYASGVSLASPNFTYTQTDSGADRLVTINASHDGYYRVTVDGASRTNVGIQLNNNSNVLTISSDDYGYGYVGNATYVGSTQSDSWLQGVSYTNGPGSGWVATTNGSYYRLYTIDTGSTSAAPMCFIQALGNGNYNRIVSISLGSGTTWNVWVAGNQWSTVPQIKCFARLMGTGASGYGIKLFDANGNRTWDSGANMLVLSQIIDVSSPGTTSGTGGLIVQTQTVGHSVPNPYFVMQNPGYVSAQTTPKDFGSPVTSNEWMDSAACDSSTIYRSSAALPCTAYSTTGTLNASYSNNLALERFYMINGNSYP